MPRDSPRPLPPPAHHPPAASTRAARAVAMVGGACGPGARVRRAAGGGVMRIGSLFSGIGHTYADPDPAETARELDALGYTAEGCTP